ncbi:STP1 protein [Plasmodium malariae]|uniref:STP1 protein n=1 Tax=Plasmodium malariae TaxID=5858 RepID=A0A1D3JII1_PLAMA|nr:STP1 protein [Plasmodium malariae]SBT86134.1 STP1 protein [Plasmodium malariae]
MEKCFSLHISVRGKSFFRFLRDQDFKNITKNIIEKTSLLNNENNKEEFRKKCLDLANYVIHNKIAPSYHNQVIWERAIKGWVESHYEKLNKYGGCPLILEEKDKNFLKMKYEEVDFCEKKNEYLKEIKRLSKKSKDSYRYSNKCNEYNEWIGQMKKHFEAKKSLFGTCYGTKNKKKQNKESSEFTCDLMNDQTFEQPTYCPPVDKLQPREGESENVQIVSQTKDKEKKGESPVLHDSPEQAEPTEGAATNQMNHDTKHNQHEEKNKEELEPPSAPEAQTQAHLSSLESPSNEVEANSENSLQSPTQAVFSNSQPFTEVSGEFVSLASVPLDTNPENPSKSTLSSTISKSPPSSLASTIPSVTSGQLKKKRRIKRRQPTFLKILIPSHSDRIKEFLNHNHLEHPCYDDEEITKKIKIREHKMIKNLRESKQKKERSKTIIEVHMEVLQEWKNEEWNYKKREFLEICLEVFTKELYGLYPNLTNDELIMENIKSSNDIEKQKNLWNKWIERHRNISEKLNKVDWYNNLKNEWKKEKFYIKEMEELKNISSNKNQYNLFLEKEKNLWKKWISKKAEIIEQHFEQDCFKGLTEEYQNLLNEYKNDEYENDVSIINIEELEHKENYEELYKYIKTKLLSKLCILVLMTILEECKKEEYIEDRELHLDSSINERKTKKNSVKKKKLQIYLFKSILMFMKMVKIRIFIII